MPETRVFQRMQSPESGQSGLWHGTTILTVRKGGVVGDRRRRPGLDRPDHRQGQRQEGAPARQGRRDRRLCRRHRRRLHAVRAAGGQARAISRPAHPRRVELAKDWRTDRYLRRLEAMMIVADKEVSLVLTGTGDVLEPEAGVMGIGSGGNYALAAARALARRPTRCRGDRAQVARHRGRHLRLHQPQS